MCEPVPLTVDLCNGLQETSYLELQNIVSKLTYTNQSHVPLSEKRQRLLLHLLAHSAEHHHIVQYSKLNPTTIPAALDAGRIPSLP
jgi:hypothetical protein